MYIFVRHAKRSGPSGRKIATFIQDRIQGRVEAGRRIPNGDIDFVVNWGSVLAIDSGVVFNKPENVADACFKTNTFGILLEAGIQIPMWIPASDLMYRDNLTWWYGEQISWPIMARKQLGRGGRDIRICHSKEEAAQYVDSHDFFSELIDKEFEFRVHVAFGKVIKVSQKIFDPTKGKPYNPYIWNYRKGFVFKNPRFDEPDTMDYIKRFAVESMEALGLDFGAVDIIVNSDNVIWVLEINTAPGVKALSSANAYGDAFAEQIHSRSLNN